MCLAAFGLFAISSMLAALAMLLVPAGQAPGRAVIDQDHVIRLMAYELTVLAALGWVLAVRGWTRAKIGLEASWGASGLGVALAVVAMWISMLLSSALVAHGGALAQLVASTRPAVARIEPLTIAALCIVNPLYEETFVSGYLITALKRTRGFWFAANASAGLRLLYHLYQGPVAVVGILPVGLLFAYWYARTGRLWPLVVAHALLDAIALAASQ